MWGDFWVHTTSGLKRPFGARLRFMRSPSDISLELTARWETLGIEAETLETDESGTLVREAVLGATVTAKSALDATYVASSDNPDLATSMGSSISVGQTIGQGGMGLIRVATQHALKREVVIKSVRSDVNQEHGTAHILGEAWITGMLEHPNIIPIHDISHQASGEPMIVMKRIEGKAWSELISKDGSEGSALERHIDILRQVANAVHYAHSKGLIHRDLKPDNVMLGLFGEVYVLDWGIAAAFDPLLTSLPQLSQTTQLAGSPRYMAPEMVAVDTQRLGPCTDVYLLGAILHELLTGSPPHEGATLLDTMQSAYASETPRLDASSEEGLVGVCRKAMARDPESRYASAEAFRDALEACLHQRGSRALAEQAHERLRELETWLDELDAALPDKGRQRAYELLSASRFGFNQALSDWPENPTASEGLQRALRLMVHYELEHGSSRAAASLVSALPKPDPELEALVERGAQKTREDAERLKALEAEADTTSGSRVRSASIMLQGFGLGMVALVSGHIDRNLLPLGYEAMSATVGLFALIHVPIVLNLSRFVAPTRTNRLLVHCGFFAALFYTGLWLYGWAQGLDFVTTLSVNLAIASLGCGLLGLVLDRWLLATSLSFLIGALLVPIWPEFKFEILGLAMMSGLGSTAIGWSRRSEALVEDEALQSKDT